MIQISVKRIWGAIILLPLVWTANAAEKQDKVAFKFGGRVDALGFVDTYESKATRRGIHYFFPLAPKYDPQGNDLHKESSLRAGAAPSRLNATVLAPEILGAVGKAFVEADFMGTSDNTFGGFRLRHAYMSLDWERGQFLAGQTDHLSIPVEVTPDVVSYGGANPINPLARLPQFRYTHKLTRNLSAAAAVGIFGGTYGEMQSAATVPDVQLKLAWTESGRWMMGVSGGFRAIRPRKITDDEVKTTKKMSLFQASAYGSYTFGGGYCVKLFGMWGQDLSALSMMGGFAPKLTDVSTGNPDYGYMPIRSMATWLDFSTRKFNGWQAGIYAGWAKNLGTSKDIDLSCESIGDYSADGGIDWHIRIAPRVYYQYKNLSFGLEYMYSLASWGETFSARYRPVERYDNTSNHRVTLLTRFKF